jgi:hypothetical protein
VVHKSPDSSGENAWSEPDGVVRLVHELGGEFRVKQEADGSVATAIRLTALSE